MILLFCIIIFIINYLFFEATFYSLDSNFWKALFVPSLLICPDRPFVQDTAVTFPAEDTLIVVLYKEGYLVEALIQERL